MKQRKRIAYQQSEAIILQKFDLQRKEHFIPVKEYGLKVRVQEIGRGYWAIKYAIKKTHESGEDDSGGCTGPCGRFLPSTIYEGPRESIIKIDDPEAAGINFKF